MTHFLTMSDQGVALLRQAVDYYFPCLKAAESAENSPHLTKDELYRDLRARIGSNIALPFRELLEGWKMEFLILLKDEGESKARLRALNIGVDLAVIAHGAVVCADELRHYNSWYFSNDEDLEEDWEDTCLAISRECDQLRELAIDCNKLQILMTCDLAKVDVDSYLLKKIEPVETEEFSWF